MHLAYTRSESLAYDTESCPFFDSDGPLKSLSTDQEFLKYNNVRRGGAVFLPVRSNDAPLSCRFRLGFSVGYCFSG